MLYFAITGAALLVLIFITSRVLRYLPAWLNWRVLAPALLLFNFLDWYVTGILVAHYGLEIEGNPVMRFLLGHSYAGDIYKLVWGSAICLVASFLRKEIPIAFGLLLIIVLVINFACLFMLANT